MSFSLWIQDGCLCEDMTNIAMIMLRGSRTKERSYDEVVGEWGHEKRVPSSIFLYVCFSIAHHSPFLIPHDIYIWRYTG